MLNFYRDEILYHARLHPEQYSDTFSAPQLKQLHTSIRYVCQTAVDLLADSSQFPDEWLFNHRWGKGKKDAATTLSNGEKITFLTVGGRTSCVVPSVQKKTGAVAGEIKQAGTDQENVGAPTPKSKKQKAVEKTSEPPEVKVKPAAKSLNRKGTKRSGFTEIDPDSKSTRNKVASKVKDTATVTLEQAKTSTGGKGQKRKSEVAAAVEGDITKSKKRKALAPTEVPATSSTIKTENKEKPNLTNSRRRSGRAPKE